ncbi:MAG: proline dehydrogenase family protein [Prevotellaceae bacterium]|jgi:proline dehydrogenase|nr:proline dehydrogenase family protein [Prevotellaceae bacterium]
MIDFSNTEIAFKVKSNGELKNARFLFSMIKHPWLVKFLGGLSNFALKIHFPIGWIIKPTLYRHFVGGETIEECVPTAEKLFKYKVYSLLDYSVEAAKNEKAMGDTAAEIRRGIDFAAKHDYVPYTVFKPSALANTEVLEKVSKREPLNDEEKATFDKFIQRVDVLCAAAEQSGKPIMFDAEDYCIQQAIDDVTEQMMAKYNTKDKANVFNTLQMYRHDRLYYLKHLIEISKRDGYVIGCKYVRGAYMEKERERAAKGGYPSPIYPDKQGTDNAYNEALRLSVENIDHIHIFNGTHNEESIKCLIDLIEKHKLDKKDKRIFFSQLYGMSDNLSFNTAEAGYNVVKYLPYGKIRNVLPYLIRRAEENTAIAGQTTRELSLIKEEVKRRKAAKK